MSLVISGGIHDCIYVSRRDSADGRGSMCGFPALGEPAPSISAYRDPVLFSPAVITPLLGSACSRLGIGRGLQCLGDWTQADFPQSSLAPWCLG